MNDGPALYQAILVTPEDDLARLKYADWLDDNNGEVTCSQCGGLGWVWVGRECPCSHCDGTGTIPNNYDKRAEFIRTQIEVAKQKKGVYSPASLENDKRQDALERRCRDLLKYNIPPMGSVGNHWVCTTDIGMVSGTYNRPVALYTRGFISNLTILHRVNWTDNNKGLLAVLLSEHPITEITDRSPISGIPRQMSLRMINEGRGLAGLPPLKENTPREHPPVGA